MMPAARRGRRRLVLVGLGHIHIRLLMRRPALLNAFDICVIAPHRACYGGAVAPMLAGELDRGRFQLDTPDEVSIQKTRAVGAKPVHRRLWLADGTIITYDALSLNTGTRRLPAFAATRAANQPRIWSGHSAADLIGLRRALNGEERASIVVAGGTDRAIEIAGGLSAKAKSNVHVTLLLPDNHAGRGDRRAHHVLAWRGVDIVSLANASALGAGCVETTDGRRFAADHLVWAGPPGVSTFAQALKLPIAGPGLKVDRRLQCVQASTIFAVGALASIDERYSLPGWDADRQAEILLANVLGMYDQNALRRYRAPRDDPDILDLAAGDVVTRAGLRWRAQRRLSAGRNRWLPPDI